MAICWERAIPLAFHLCFNFSAVLVERVPFPFGVWGRMWNSIVSVPDRCHFCLLEVVAKICHQQLSYKSARTYVYVSHIFYVRCVTYSAVYLITFCCIQIRLQVSEFFEAKYMGYRHSLFANLLIKRTMIKVMEICIFNFLAVQLYCSGCYVLCSKCLSTRAAIDIMYMAFCFTFLSFTKS